MDLAPLLYIIRATEMPLLFLIRGLLLMVSAVSVVSVILTISSVGRVDFPVVMLLLRGPLAMRLKKSSPSLESLNACVSDHEQISHHLGLLHGDLLHSLDVTNSVVEGVNDLDVLDVRDSVPGIAKMFHVVLKALIMLLSDGIQSLNSRWMLVRALAHSWS
jgi:hypothetical protein